MKWVVITALLLAIVASVARGCAGESPTDAAKAFYRAGNEGNYTKAEDYLGPEKRVVLRELVGRFDNAMDAATKGGTITRVEAEEGMGYGGDSLAVVLTLHYEDGSQEEDILHLSKIDGRWRIHASQLLLLAPFIR